MSVFISLCARAHCETSAPYQPAEEVDVRVENSFICLYICTDNIKKFVCHGLYGMKLVFEVMGLITPMEYQNPKIFDQFFSSEAKLTCRIMELLVSISSR